MKTLLYSLTTCVFTGLTVIAQDAASPLAEIPRRIPPVSDLEFPPEERAKIEERLKLYEDRTWEKEGEPYEADMAVFVKAVRLAMRHKEFYSKKEFALAAKMLDLADARYAELDKEEPTASWQDQRGLLVRGYRSSIDDSVQPYGLEIPENLDLSKPVPLLVWLHGRGDKTTDLHFIQRCLTKSQALGGKVSDQQDAIIVHPFGRHCVGFKHAGEIDVLEVIEDVKKHYPIDPDRVALAGFSMGGAGAWHIGAHYRDQFCAVHPGAGFAETAEYNKLKPEDYPPEYEQTLWTIYDVPNYARNFLNGPLLAYSGEEDKQKQAADVMEAALKEEGFEMRHVIGPGMGHKYHDDSAAEIWEWLKECWEQGRDPFPRNIELQTRTLRYGKMYWLTVTGMEAQWEDTQVSAKWDDAEKKISITAKNVSAFRIDSPSEIDLADYEVTVNGTSLKVDNPGFPITSLLVHQDGDSKWQWGEPAGLTKTNGLQGPIDDVFLHKFIVVPPDQILESELADDWVDFELDHFRKRWTALMRGNFKERESSRVDSLHAAESNLILWGDPSSNKLIEEIVKHLPIVWTEDEITIDGKTYDPKTHLPVLIYPNPIAPDRYVVINSGHTFREGHDRTNSLQNAKLPDWAVISLETPPNEFAPGKIVAAGFFSENWK